jgi:hypothetical protein
VASRAERWRRALRFAELFLVALALPLGAWLGANPRYIWILGTPVGLLFLAVMAANRSQLWLAWRRRVDFGVKVPLAGEGGSAALTGVLADIHGRIRRRVQQDMRVTAFVPDSSGNPVQLRQLARWTSDGSPNVSATSHRAGVCCVGHAFSERQNWTIPDVNLAGGFEKALRACGMTDDEIREQRERPTSFFATPVIVRHDGVEVVLAVIAVDSNVACNSERLGAIVAEFWPRLASAILGEARTDDAKHVIISQRPPALPYREAPSNSGPWDDEGDDDLMQRELPLGENHDSSSEERAQSDPPTGVRIPPEREVTSEPQGEDVAMSDEERERQARRAR